MSLINYSTAYGIANPNAMAGGGIGQFLGKVREVAHKIKPVSTINRLVKIAGVEDQLNNMTNGAYGRAIEYGLKQKGYGRRKRSGKKKGKK